MCAAVLCAASALKPAVYCAIHSRGAEKSWLTCGSETMAAPRTWEMKVRAAPAGQVRSLSPCRSTHGLPRRLIGRKSTPRPRALRVNSSPDPLHSGFCKLKSGQKPSVSAAAKVLRGACASTAYAMAAPEETPTSIGVR